MVREGATPAQGATPARARKEPEASSSRLGRNLRSRNGSWAHALNV